MIANHSVSIVPLLIVVLFIVVMGGIYAEHRDGRGQLELLVAFVQEEVVLPVHHAVAIGTVFGENLETSSD